MRKITDKHYTELYIKVMGCLEFNQVQEIHGPDFVLNVHVEKLVHYAETTGGSDDYGNRERIGLSTCDVSVLNYWVVDENNDFADSDFDPITFEMMFE